MQSFTTHQIRNRNSGLLLNLPTQINLNGLNSGEEGYVSFAQIPELMEVKKLSYVYNYVDHTSTSLSTGFGNIRLSYTEDPKHPNELIILEENNYYPFGLKHQDYIKELKKVDFWKYAGLPQQEIIDHAEKYVSIVPVVKGEYKYKYQEQERQEELGINEDMYKFRVYDYSLGRFWQIDPLSDKYNWFSNYAFSENRVVDGRELEGLEYISMHHYMEGGNQMKVVTTVYYNKDDKWIKDRGGTTADFYNAASYGREGKGVKHIFYNSDKSYNGPYRDGTVIWDQRQNTVLTRLSTHGLYSGSSGIGSISDGFGNVINVQPIDYADAIAKRHDFDYIASENKNPYNGSGIRWLEDVNTLQADLDMVKRAKSYKSQIFLKPWAFVSISGVETPFRTSWAGETTDAIEGQLLIISKLAEYKKWKVKNGYGNETSFHDISDGLKKKNGTLWGWIYIINSSGADE
ncbi:MAG: hypothetical protein Q4G27_02820 [Flavobacteriaceae bacterium]|nr:hypothetical protein [Flavobacteriaceae bacterium]